MAEKMTGGDAPGPFKCAGRALHPEGSVVDVGGIRFGGGALHVIVEPASAESGEELAQAALAARDAGASLLSGGVLKTADPYRQAAASRTERLTEAAHATRLPLALEVASAADIGALEGRAALFLVCGRNMQNYELLKMLGHSGTPVLLQRGTGATLEEWLLAAEYIMSGGNEAVILCAGSIGTFEAFTHNSTMDLSAVPAIKKLSHLPVLVDAGSVGVPWMAGALARAAVAAGADGVLLQVEEDGEEALTFKDLCTLIRELRALAQAVGRTM